MFNLFNNSKIDKARIEQLEELNLVKQQRINSLLEQLDSKQKELIDDFILILEQIQKTNNKTLQWKKRQTVIRNEVTLALENYEQKLVELKEKF